MAVRNGIIIVNSLPIAGTEPLKMVGIDVNHAVCPPL